MHTVIKYGNKHNFHFKKITVCPASSYPKISNYVCCTLISQVQQILSFSSSAGTLYFNYMDFHSIVMLALVDHNYKF
jgi:hypothetical protein